MTNQKGAKQMTGKKAEEIRRIAQAAQEAFWTKVVELIPDAKSGDFPPDETRTFDHQCFRAVMHWAKLNSRRYGALTLEEFRNSRVYTNLREYGITPDSDVTDMEKSAEFGYVYADGSCYIKKSPGNNDQWYLIIERSEYESNDLPTLEKILYEQWYLHEVA